MPRKKVAVCFYIEPEQYERLKALSARTHVPISFYVREGVDAVLVEHEAKRKR